MPNVSELARLEEEKEHDHNLLTNLEELRKSIRAHTALQDLLKEAAFQKELLKVERERVAVKAELAVIEAKQKQADLTKKIQNMDEAIDLIRLKLVERK